jgi:hypothetical protein
MLVGHVIEKSSVNHTWEIAANKLADRIRNTWLDNRKAGITSWEDGFGEDYANIEFMRKEGIPNLVNVDYIFRWWGAADPDDFSGQVDIIWTIEKEQGQNEFYRTWIKLAELDFLMGTPGTEADRRENNRKAFREAFGEWMPELAKL